MKRLPYGAFYLFETNEIIIRGVLRGCRNP